MSHRPIHEMEKKWQDAWDTEQTYRAVGPEDPDAGTKFYGLIEFPFPSGDGLHVGHPRSNTAIDIMTRKRRMEGANVLFPIGFDAFGLPTENYAIKHKMKPADATKKNIANFTRQLKSLGFGFDWSRAVDTTDPKYYKWTQWQFLQFFKHGMAYKATTTINWCPRCKIGLANEEAQGGVCERCGNPVEQREKAQWMLRITKYADRLIADLDTVEYLPQVKAQQINWIGKSEGANVDFEIQTAGTSPSLSSRRGIDRLTVFTTRPDTLFGVTYVVVAPEHPLLDTWLKEGDVKNADEVVAYRADVAAKADEERTAEGKLKTGVVVEGVTAVHPVTGESVQVWTADYVLATYGTGAVMAVPAHDERDFVFAQAFGLPIKQVMELPRDVFRGIGAMLQTKSGKFLFQVRDEHAPTRPGMIACFGGGLDDGDGDGIACAIRELKEELELDVTPADLEYGATIESHSVPGKFHHMYIARNIDPASLVVHEGAGSIELSLEEALAHEKVTPYTKDAIRVLQGKTHGAFTEEGIAINSDLLNGLPTWKAKEDMTSWLAEHKKGEKAVTYKLRDWVFSRQRYWGEPIPLVHCAKDGYVAVPDAQLPVTLPDVEAYEPTDTGESPLATIRSWVETTCPTCGGPAERETDTMPNWAGSSWYFMRYCDPHNDAAFASPEALKYWMPVDLYNGGMEHTTLHLLYSRFWHKFLWDIGAIPEECGSEPYAKRRSHGMILAETGEKMSKSKGNVINPDDVVAAYGADVFRMYEMFMGPFDQAVPWDTNGIEGVKRFLDKVWGVMATTTEGAELETLYHQTLKKLTEGIEHMQFNTCVSQLMILTNAYQAAGGVPTDQREGYVKMLAPFAPHLAEELWRGVLGMTTSVHARGAGWPTFDPAKTISATFELVVQVNGKVRDRITVPSDISEGDAKAQALASDAVQKQLAGATPKQVIYVKGRLVSVVV